MSCSLSAESRKTGPVSSLNNHQRTFFKSAPSSSNTDSDAALLFSILSTLHTLADQATNQQDVDISITNALGLDRTLSFLLDTTATTPHFAPQLMQSIAPIMYSDSNVTIASNHAAALCELIRTEACKEEVPSQSSLAIKHRIQALVDVITRSHSASSAYKLLFLKSVCHAVLGLIAVLQWCGESLASTAAELRSLLLSLSGLPYSKLTSKHFNEVSDTL